MLSNFTRLQTAPEMDSEKQQLIEARILYPAEDHASDCECSDGLTAVDGLWPPDSLCQVEDVTPEDEEKSSARQKLYMAFVVSMVFMIGEVIGGYLAHSLAIMTDAAHLLTDLGSIVISIFSLWMSSRPHTEIMTFGWHRAEILGMMLSVMSIWAVTAVLVVSAAQRISDGNYDIDSDIMLLTSGCAVAVNVLMVLILHQSGDAHGHSHGLSSLTRGKRLHDHGSHGNASVKAAFIHVVGDLVQSVGVLLAAIIIHFWPEYKVADPICTFLFSVLVLGTTYSITKDVCRILMNGSPERVAFRAVKKLLLTVNGVSGVHSLHVWSLNMTHSVLSVHVVAEKTTDHQLLLQAATTRLRSEFGFRSITIQVESNVSPDKDLSV
ncbi:proton-coupled zinc antiporter SLC30A2-like [Synchiropus splendidus]|uniref:proton-coupled zinc antiporter SLC30A2-like n=1 Tax=Synchiropus splendidus TaxID=270530 RepID=UPI00237E5D57|nr:proton-coupled zinc antiporter SLC30A2-like [Synchiropus splendidus]